MKWRLRGGFEWIVDSSEFDFVFAAEDASIRPRLTFHWRFKCQLYLDTQNPFNASLRPLKMIFKFATSPLPTQTAVDSF